MEIFGLQVLALVIGALLGGFISVLVYRNNESQADTFFDKFDERFTHLENQFNRKINELKSKIDDRR